MAETPENKVLDYIDDIIYFRKHDDKEGMAALMAEGEAEYVTLKDVATAVLDIVDDFTTFVDASQAINEVRLRAIVESLDEELQEKIKQKFMEAEDDLFDSAEGEQ